MHVGVVAAGVGADVHGFDEIDLLPAAGTCSGGTFERSGFRYVVCMGGACSSTATSTGTTTIATIITSCVSTSSTTASTTSFNGGTRTSTSTTISIVSGRRVAVATPAFRHVVVMHPHGGNRWGVG